MERKISSGVKMEPVMKGGHVYQEVPMMEVTFPIEYHDTFKIGG